MTPASTEFDIVRGDDSMKKFIFSVNGVDLDLSGQTVTLTAKTDPTGSVVFSSEGTVATNIVTFAFAAADISTAGSYYYDVQAVAGADKRRTLIIGTVNVLQDINQA